MKRSTLPKRDEPRQESERTRQIFQPIREVGDPEAKKNAIVEALLPSTLILAVVAAAIAGLFYWQSLQKKRTEWEVSDPMALVKELYLVHRLSEPEKRLMLELSKKNALSNPLKLFVEPKYLLAAWEDDSLRSSRSSVRLLLTRLFDITTEVGESTAVSGTYSDTIDYSPERRTAVE